MISYVIFLPLRICYSSDTPPSNRTHRIMCVATYLWVRYTPKNNQTLWYRYARIHVQRYSFHFNSPVSALIYYNRKYELKCLYLNEGTSNYFRFFFRCNIKFWSFCIILYYIYYTQSSLRKTYIFQVVIFSNWIITVRYYYYYTFACKTENNIKPYVRNVVTYILTVTLCFNPRKIKQIRKRKM